MTESQVRKIINEEISKLKLGSIVFCDETLFFDSNEEADKFRDQAEKDRLYTTKNASGCGR